MLTVCRGSPTVLTQHFSGRDQAPAWGGLDASGRGGPCGLPTHVPLPAAAEDLSDSDEVFAKEMTKWSSNDFLDTLERPVELDEALGEWWGGLAPKPSMGVLGGGQPPPGHPGRAHRGHVFAADGAGAAKADGEGLGASGFPEVRALPPRPFPRSVPPTLARVPMAALSFPQGGSAESAGQACRIHALFLILHSGNILDQGAGEPGSKQADVQTLAATFDAVTRVHFPEALGHVALRLVPCPPICAAAYALVSKYGWQRRVPWPCTVPWGEDGGLFSWKTTLEL